VRLPVDLIVAGTTFAARVAQHATRTISIIVAVSGHPVGDGFVASLARPGGNITGLSVMSREVSGKRLDLLTEAVPGLAHVALLLDATAPRRDAQLHDHEVAAHGLGVHLLPLDVRGPDEFAGAFQAAIQRQAQALILIETPLFGTHRTELAALALTNRLPTIGGIGGYAAAGGLMDYGVSQGEGWDRAATYVDKILRGAKPGDLPMEQPTKFKLVLNLKTAKALGRRCPHPCSSWPMR
jgi:putative ABC transport system substrate-binding protein